MGRMGCVCVQLPPPGTTPTLPPRGSTPASSALGHVQALATLTWLILASMRGWAAGEATNSDPLTTTPMDMHHTSTVVIHLLEHVSPEHFVQQVATIVRDAISRLAQLGTEEEEIKTVFVFIQVWDCLHDVKRVRDGVSYISDNWHAHTHTHTHAHRCGWCIWS